MRSNLVVGAVGNHDISVPKHLKGKESKKSGKKQPDMFAYRYLWNQPVNGPANLPKKCVDLSRLDLDHQSTSLLNVDDDTATLKQVAINGKGIDEFKITK